MQAAQATLPQASLILELEDTLEHASVARGAEALRHIGDFFAAGAGAFDDAQVAVFDRVITRLIDAAQPASLSALARRLAPFHNAPRAIILRLATYPDIAVAAPVLARSPCLADEDLIAIASTETQAHKLAISGRTTVGTDVSDALADCGDRDVIRNLVMNSGARLSPGGLAMLAARAVDDCVLAEKLARRADVPRVVLRELLRQASARVRAHLVKRLGADMPADLGGTDEPPRDVAEAVEHVEAWRTVRVLQRAGRLDETHVRHLAESGRERAAAVALATICHMPFDVVRGLTDGRQPDAALILCQSAGFAAPAAHAIVRALSSRANRAAVETTLARFEDLSTDTAEQIVAFWRAAA